MERTSSPGRVIRMWTVFWSSLDRCVSFCARRRNEWKKRLLPILWSRATGKKKVIPSILKQISGKNVQHLLDCKYFSNCNRRSSTWRGLRGSNFLDGNSGNVSKLNKALNWSCMWRSCLYRSVQWWFPLIWMWYPYNTKIRKSRIDWNHLEMLTPETIQLNDRVYQQRVFLDLHSKYWEFNRGGLPESSSRLFLVSLQFREWKNAWQKIELFKHPWKIVGLTRFYEHSTTRNDRKCTPSIGIQAKKKSVYSLLPNRRESTSKLLKCPGIELIKFPLLLAPTRTKRVSIIPT